MAGARRIRVIVVDDHAVVRGGLRLFLLAFEDLELVGEAGDGEKALQLCEQVQPDVVLMDLVMSGMNGIQATQAIRERYPHVQVVALTSFPEEALVQWALEAGAISYLLKSVSANELAAAIRAAHAGPGGGPGVDPQCSVTSIGSRPDRAGAGSVGPAGGRDE